MAHHAPRRLLNSPQPHSRRKAQGIVEFALALPVALLLIFGIIEFARIFQSWLSVQNGARFAVRYAVTGEFDVTYCAAADTALGYTADDAADGAIDCLVPRSVANYDTKTEQLIDWARIPSIRDVARDAAVAIARNDSATGERDNGYFHVTICSTRDDNKDGYPDFSFSASDPSNFVSAQCLPHEDPGGPGDRVIVAIDFTHPLFTPFLSNVWPNVRLTSRREGIVESFRKTRVINLPPTISAPTPTSTPTPTPTITPTPTDTFTPTPTDTPTDTPTPTLTPTQTDTPEPSCDRLSINNPRISIENSEGNVKVDISNQNPIDVFLVKSSLDWTKYYGNQYVDYFKFYGFQYYNGDDVSSPTTSNPSAPGVRMPGNSSDSWVANFNNIPSMEERNSRTYPRVVGSFTINLGIDIKTEVCPLKAVIPPVTAKIVIPSSDRIAITNVNQTNFEALAYESPGTNNGYHIDQVHFQIYDQFNSLIYSSWDGTNAYCVFGGDQTGNCNLMPDSLYNTLTNGQYTLWAWAKSSITNVWSYPDIVSFTLSRTVPTTTQTTTITPTPTMTRTPTVTSTFCPPNICTPSPTPSRTPTNTPKPTDTRAPTATYTLTPTKTKTPTKTSIPTSTKTPTKTQVGPTNTPVTPSTNTPVPTPTQTPTPVCFDC